MLIEATTGDGRADIDGMRVGGAHLSPNVHGHRSLSHDAESLWGTTESDWSLPEYLLHNIERLMNAYHENGAQLYKILCPELDKLIEIMHQADVYGGRVTGPFDSVSIPFSLMLTCSYSFRRRLGELHDLSRCRAPRDGVHSGSHSGQHLPELGEEELKKIGFVTKSSYGAFGTLVETPSLSKMDSDGIVIV